MRLKKIISLILAVVLLIICLTLTVSAEDIVSGTAGTITYEINHTEKTITISGTGYVPKNLYSNYIKNKMIGKEDYVLKIEEGITAIGENAFNGIIIENIVIPNSVTWIDDNAFSNAQGQAFEGVFNIPDNIETIGKGIFENTNITEIRTTENSKITEFKNCFGNMPKLERVYLPNYAGFFQTFCIETIITIFQPPMGAMAVSAYIGCPNLKEVYIPNAKYLVSPFRDCTSLEEIVIPTSCYSIQDISVFGYNANNQTPVNCSLKTITFSEEPTENQREELRLITAFSYCSLIKSVLLPQDVPIDLVDSAFRNCTSLKNVELPNGITEIPNNSFVDCSSLESLNIPSRVEEIGDFAFQNCTSLKNITIPNNTNSIGRRAFYNCTSLTDVFIKNEIPVEIENQIFDNCSNDLTIWLQRGSLDDYQQAECWHPYAHLLKEIDYNLTVQNYEDKHLSAEKQAEFNSDKVSIVNHIANNLIGVSVAKYLDIELRKTGYDFTDETMHNNTLVEEDTEQWEVRVPIPQELLSDNIDFYIIRVHNGVAETLDSEVQGNEIVFSTNKFSTYALAYRDNTLPPQQTPPDDNEDIDTNTDGNTDNDTNTNKEPTIFINPYVQQIIANKPEKINPTTGGYDYTSVYLISALMVLTAILIIKIN